MNYQFLPIGWILLIATLINIFIAIIAWQKRSRPVAKYLFLLTCGTAVWTFSYIFETAATNVSHVLLWAQISYLGIAVVPLSYFLLSLAYSQYHRYLISRNIILLSIVPLFTLLMVATQNWHHMFYTSISIDPNTNLPIYGYSIWFWLNTIYSYLLLAIGVILLLKTTISVQSIYKSQIIILIIGAILPFTGNIIYVFKINPVPGLDWTPITFGLSGLFLAWGILGFQLLKLVPIARHTLVETTHTGVMVIDSQGIIIDYNPAMQVITGISPKEAIGQKVIQALANWIEFISNYNVKEDSMEEIHLTKQDTKYWYNMRITVLNDHHKRFAGQIIMFGDITEQKQATEKLKKSEKLYRTQSLELAESNAMKELLLDIIAHDLKNPASVIKGFADFGIETDPENEFLKEIQNGTDSLLKVIDNATVLSRVASGDKIDKEAIDITEMIRTIANEFAFELDNGKMKIEMNIKKKIIIKANPIISEVFRNYISNAIKYASTGKRIIIDTQDENGYVTINIIDHGDTIAEEERGNIFKRSVQLNKTKGSGLGLAIVKRIAEAHKAVVGVKPNKPRGNNFYIKIPTL